MCELRCTYLYLPCGLEYPELSNGAISASTFGADACSGFRNSFIPFLVSCLQSELETKAQHCRREICIPQARYSISYCIGVPQASVLALTW